LNILSDSWEIPVDPGEWGLFLEKYRLYLELIARGIRMSSENPGLDVDDLVQETLIRAHEKFPLFRGASEPELTRWLRRILNRLAIDQMRRINSNRRRSHRWARQLDDAGVVCEGTIPGRLAISWSTPSGKAQRRELAVLVAHALEQLPPDYRNVILLRQFDGLSLSETANRLGRTNDSVEKLWARGLVALRRLLKHLA
jgi:RNA polymerase sigma-70 factor (ECF subfamily)